MISELFRKITAKLFDRKPKCILFELDMVEQKAKAGENIRAGQVVYLDEDGLARSANEEIMTIDPVNNRAVVDIKCGEVVFLEGIPIGVQRASEFFGENDGTRPNPPPPDR